MEKNRAINKKEKTEEPAKQVDKEAAAVADFVAAGFISAVSKSVVYPMETRVLLAQIGEHTANDARLWHGVAVKGFENFLYNGLLWFLKERLRPPAPDPARPDARPPVTFWGAFCASCAAVLLAHPSSIVVVGMQASLKQPSGPASAMHVTKAIMQADGLGGFFKGWRLSIALRGGSAMALVVYELVRARLFGVLGGDLSNFVAALLGRLADVYLCHPLKTMRSRQQQGKSFLPSYSPAALLGLWTGVHTMAVADAVKIGIRFLLIERLRKLLLVTLSRRRQHVDSKFVECKVALAEVKDVQDAAVGA